MSGLSLLSTRDIIGRYFKTLEQDAGTAWISSLSNMFNSDQASETYKWIGQVPSMREWIGARQAQGLDTYGITIKNLEYESTLEFTDKEMRRDKTGQIDIRIREHSQRANTHIMKLLSALVSGGESSVCYDGQYFFDTDHTEASSGTQSNDLSIDISALPAQTHGSTTNPSVEEMKAVILQGIQAIVGFKDNQGEPMNEMAKEFLVMCPISLYSIALAAATSLVITSGQTNELAANFSVKVIPNVRLSWTDKVAIFRTDANVKSFITQQEVPIEVSATSREGDLWFDKRMQRFGLYWSGNVGYGYWQNACLATMV